MIARQAAPRGRLCAGEGWPGGLPALAARCSAFLRPGAWRLPLALGPEDGVIGRPSLWIAEDFGCCASG